MNAKHSRDRSVDELLRHALIAQPTAQASEACLDAETLAAWVDGGLDATALALAETHAASCARCQALVAAMVRTAPEPALRTAWWRRDWRVRWMVPLTATAAAVLLWMVVPDRPTGSPVSDYASSQSRPEPLAAPPPPSPAEETAPATRRLAPSNAEAKREAPTAPLARGGGASAPLAKERDLSERAAAKAQRTKEQSADAPTAQRSVASAAPDRRGANEAAPPPAVPIAPSPAEATAVDSLPRFGVASAVGAASGTREILSPNPAIRWRLGPGGSVYFSTDAGLMWELVSTGAAADLTSGSSPSPSICWLVGRGGAVLRTTDGRRWERLPFPEPVDLESVQAVDAHTAVVTSSDGRTFRTADAGQTWMGGRR